MAADAAAALEGPDRRALEVLLRMPLLPCPALAALLGVRSGAVWARLGRLAARDLVAAVAVPGVRKRPVRLWHLTDLGLAALAGRLGREPVALARAAGHDRKRLAALLASLPAHLALCDAARLLAAAGPGQPRLLGWWRPWRATFTPASRATPVRLGLPARLALAWGDAAGPRRDDPVGDYLLLPDCGAVPPAYWAPALAALARWVAAGAATPTGLLIALTNPLADAARRPARSAAGR
ncbi:MAG TPA: hypothetical protein VFL91_04280, partial [Thermomicrobiales bacterium]|nr:hypothetical protein [Thermomicrobiales bacterium]